MLGLASKYLRNIAIIAHVDHGKTTLVDTLLRQSGTYMSTMDKLDLEQERGITIMSKCTSLMYNNYWINIVDTPGHADFGGQVERVISIADGVLLLVCAQEGPMPQTRFVLKKALEQNLKSIVVINKMDRTKEKVSVVENKIFDLYCSLNAPDHLMDYPILYASARDGWVDLEVNGPRENCKDLLDTIVDQIPPPVDTSNDKFKLLVSMQERDPYFKHNLIGRIHSGTISLGDEVKIFNSTTQLPLIEKVNYLYKLRGDERIDITTAYAGDIITIGGIKAQVNDTICDPSVEEVLPVFEIDPPTITVRVLVNDSPFMGQEGDKMTHQDLIRRLEFEAERDLALRVQDTVEGIQVSGRGELHLGVLFENMRREGFEFQIDKPKVITKPGPSGEPLEPIEHVTIEVPNEFMNPITEAFMERGAEYLDMEELSGTHTRLIFEIPTRLFMGLKKRIVQMTKGNILQESQVVKYKRMSADKETRGNQVITATHQVTCTDYGINHLESFGGVSFVYSGQKVYSGMVIGELPHDRPMEINPGKEKKLTNVRSVQKEDKIRLNPYKEFTTEEAFTYINDDELVEVTPMAIRIRKKILDNDLRRKKAKSAKGNSQ